MTGQIYFEDRERYAPIDPNRFQDTRTQPLSTFGADVDTASYANVRRFLSSGQLPPSDAVRVEELLNYFHPDYAQPRNGRPMALTTEVADCPWAPSHKLVLVGARARAAAPQTREGRSIVLLIDVSGSMAPADRLPMLRTALGLFVDSSTLTTASPSSPTRDRAAWRSRPRRSVDATSSSARSRT
ncbi:MAG: von Willebrand factor type A domain-containing protein [Acidobacteria bacterium]|nr:von Willebrand factor type A domain-containing protein [Acidobacteriota bacterium]